MMTAALYARLRDLEKDGRRAAIATVVRTQGSTPQVVGAKLVVTDDVGARRPGTLGGGCVEADAIDAAREVLAQGGQSLRAYELTEELAWNTGLVCGGTMWILAERGTDALDAGGRSMLAGARRRRDRRDADRHRHAPAPPRARPRVRRAAVRRRRRPA